MNASEVQELFERLNRFSDRLEKKEGEEYKWDYTFPDGVETTYILRNVKNLNEIEDEITSAFIWLWNLKDYLKELSKTIGKKPQDIENIINNDKQLAVCGDIANRLKHGDLRESRSSLFPKLGKLKLSFTKEILSSITFSGKEIEFDISRPNDIEVSIPIYDKDRCEIGDGFKFLEEGISRWEQCFFELMNAR
jgi:predicted DNA-binding protein